MSRPLQPLSESDLSVLKCLWDQGESTVRQVLDRLRDQGVDWAYTTVQTLLYRLQDKGYVQSRKDGWTLVFSAAVTRDEHLSRQLDALAERICDGSATPLMLHLVENRSFTATELRHFRQLLDRLAAEREERREP
jgi:predicted transcriptional regulator